MGNCRSCESRSIVTAKLILLDGKLQEFSWPVRVSLLLPQDASSFICSSEEMEFGEVAAAMGGDEALQPGELYFELPLGWRNRGLQAADMAALAAKASVALGGDDGGDDGGGGRNGGGCCCGWRKVGPAVLFSDKERPLLAAEGGGGRGGAGGGGGGKGHRFVAKLSVIVED